MHKLLPLLLLFSISIQAQELLHCGADEMRIQTLQANPKIAQAVVERDAVLETFTREFALRQAQGTARGGQVYTIPVVFHVIHKYGTENISREQMLDGLRILNETFRKTREDTADIHEDFKPIHADTEIEFALATKDPDGNCHSGINRIASDLTNSGDHRVKELVHWDPSMYLNVYVVSNAAGLAGHCVWPADADTIPAWDGIVIGHSYVGTIGTSDLTRSVAFAHECGHYLNLHHIWGGNNVPNFYYLPVGQQSNCGEDDLVGDTPNSIGWSNCNLNAASCGNVRDNVQNAMDYSYCNIMFTEGQKTRMHACLNSPIANRNNLWTPSNLAATGVMPTEGLCAADFEADKTLICNPNGEAVTFTNVSYHGEIDSVYWEFPGGDSPFSLMEEPVVVYYQPGSFDVSLTVYSNGQAQQITKEDYITFLPDSSWSYPFWDWFESGAALNASRWTEHSLDAENKWEMTDLGFYSDTRSVTVDNWSSTYLTVDELYSPPIDISNASQMRLAFKYAFSSQNTPTAATKLQLQVRKNCDSNWTTRLTISGSNLLTTATQVESFEPQERDLWQSEDINIPSTYFDENFQFRFVFTSGGNNRLFIDDVNVDVTADVSNLETKLGSVVYPNPANEVVNVEFFNSQPETVSAQLLGSDGKTLLQTPNKKFSTGNNSIRFEVKDLAPGVYFIRLISTQTTETKSFIIH